MAKELTVAAEIERLTAIYQELPPKQFALAQGLIAEAARLRVRCNMLWEDLQENGEVELFPRAIRIRTNGSARRAGSIRPRTKATRASSSS